MPAIIRCILGSPLSRGETCHGWSLDEPPRHLHTAEVVRLTPLIDDRETLAAYINKAEELKARANAIVDEFTAIGNDVLAEDRGIRSDTLRKEYERTVYEYEQARRAAVDYADLISIAELPETPEPRQI